MEVTSDYIADNCLRNVKTQLLNDCIKNSLLIGYQQVIQVIASIFAAFCKITSVASFDYSSDKRSNDAAMLGLHG